MVEYVKRIRQKNPGIGGGKLWRIYKKAFGDEHAVGYNRFYDILEMYGLKVRKRRRRAKTTDSDQNLPTYPNLNQDPDSRAFQPTVCQRYNIYGHLCGCSLVTDYYTKEIVGWCVGETLEAKFTIEALKMALKRIDPNKQYDLIHHSDRGVQYASFAYTDILKANGIKISMTECGDPKDNAVAERVNGIIKNELLMGMKFRGIEEARAAVASAIDFYNNERPHMSLDWMTPAEAALCSGELKKKWVSYRENHIKNDVA